jgi:hypothetical protein
VSRMDFVITISGCSLEFPFWTSLSKTSIAFNVCVSSSFNSEYSVFPVCQRLVRALPFVEEDLRCKWRKRHHRPSEVAALASASRNARSCTNDLAVGCRLPAS